MRTIIFLPLLGLASMAAAQNATPMAPTAKDAKTPPKLKCEMLEETGSRLSQHKVCYDPARRSRDRQDVRDELDRVQRDIPGPGG